jgi:hypothetical protein
LTQTTTVPTTPVALIVHNRWFTVASRTSFRPKNSSQSHRPFLLPSPPVSLPPIAYCRVYTSIFFSDCCCCCLQNRDAPLTVPTFLRGSPPPSNLLTQSLYPQPVPVPLPLSPLPRTHDESLSVVCLKCACHHHGQFSHPTHACFGPGKDL